MAVAVATAHFNLLLVKEITVINLKLLHMEEATSYHTFYNNLRERDGLQALHLLNQNNYHKLYELSTCQDKLQYLD